jgi:hypothetical protein
MPSTTQRRSIKPAFVLEPVNILTTFFRTDMGAYPSYLWIFQVTLALSGQAIMTKFDGLVEEDYSSPTSQRIGTRTWLGPS